VDNKQAIEKPVTLSSEGEKIDRVFKIAVRNALKRHKTAGNSIAIWREGKVVILTPDQIKA